MDDTGPGLAYLYITNGLREGNRRTLTRRTLVSARLIAARRAQRQDKEGSGLLYGAPRPGLHLATDSLSRKACGGTGYHGRVVQLSPGSHRAQNDQRIDDTGTDYLHVLLRGLITG